MELRSAKRRRSKDVTAGEAPPTQPDAGGVGGGGGGGDGDDVDRISGLPDGVLGEIVSLLSTKEAGRTQILSSRWRHVWRASPLVLDGADLYNQPYDDETSEEYSSDEDDMAYEAVAGAVNLVLDAHPGLVRRFCIPSLYLRNRATTVDAWLSSPKLDNLHELEFQERKEMILNFRQYQLPLPPASAFRFSATLRVATLSKCNILDSSLEGIHFPHLKQLGLEDAIISTGSLHTLISSCPVLECLLLKDIFGVGCLQINSNSLTSLGVGTCIYRENLLLLQEVIIVDAPCLVRFLFVGNPINLTVISAPKLETLGCFGFNHRRIVIGTTTIQGLDVVNLTTVLSNVKILAVAVAAWQYINLDAVIELLKCFPCLEKLYIKSPISREMNRWRLKHMDFIKSFDIRLKTIELEEYRGTQSHANFASFFLLNARELESMRLGVEVKDYHEGFFTQQHGMLQMEEWASRRARLHFSSKTCTRHAHVNHVCDLSIADPFECRC